MAIDEIIIVHFSGASGPHDFLFEKGVSAVYGPGTNIPSAAAEIMDIVREQRVAAE